MNDVDLQLVPDFIREEFRREGIDPVDVFMRAYPDEVNYIVLVDDVDLESAARIGNKLDIELARPDIKAFVIVRKAPPELGSPNRPSPVVLGVHDARAADLIRLISARSRVSLAQPSLAYVGDAQANLAAVTAGRHHLIFGRRGAGKTALLVEARRQVAEEGDYVLGENTEFAPGAAESRTPDMVRFFTYGFGGL